MCIDVGWTDESIIQFLNPTDYQWLEVAGFGPIQSPNYIENSIVEENLLMLHVKNQALS